MAKRLGIVILIVCLIFCMLSTFLVAVNSISIDEFPDVIDDISIDTFALNMSEEEYEEYYVKNGIMPAVPEPAKDPILDISKVVVKLREMYPNYNWGTAPIAKSSLQFRYGANLPILDGNSDEMQQAKQDADIPDRQFVGCGPIALMSQFQFMANYMGYININKYSDDNIYSDTNNPYVSKNKYFIYKAVLEEIGYLPCNSKGAFTDPLKFLTSAKNMIKNYGLESTCEVSGDVVIRAESWEKKVNTVKNAIDNGISVVWWTGDGFGNFEDHYMNIVGYQTWSGKDSNGNTKEYTVFRVNMNWGDSTYHYALSDIMKGSTMGFMFFKPTKSIVRLSPSNLGIPKAYNYSETIKQHVVMRGDLKDMSATVRFLRAGYVDHYDSTNTVVDGHYLSLSCKKVGAGVAYLDFEFPRAVKELYFNVSWWKSADRYIAALGEAKLQYMDENGVWQTKIDFLDSSLDLSIVLIEPTKMQCAFDQNVKRFRFYTSFKNPTYTRNGGRFILHDLTAFF